MLYIKLIYSHLSVASQPEGKEKQKVLIWVCFLSSQVILVYSQGSEL